MATSLRTAVELLLRDGTLDDFVTIRRDAGASWHRIALDLHAATGTLVTGETLRSWYCAPVVDGAA